MPRPTADELRNAGVPDAALETRDELEKADERVEEADEERKRIRDEAADLKQKAARKRDTAQRVRQEAEDEALTPGYDAGAATATKERADQLLEEAEELEPDLEAATEAHEQAKADRAEVAAKYCRQLAEPARAQLTSVVASYQALVTEDAPLIDIYADVLRPALSRFNYLRDEIRHARRKASASDRLGTFRQKRRLRDFIEAALDDPSPQAVLGLIIGDCLNWSRAERGPWSELWRKAGADLLDRPIRRPIQHAEDATIDALERDEFPLETEL